MDSPRVAALKRLARGLVYAVAAAAVTYGLAQAPALNELVPAPAFSIPVLMAGLLAADKWIRAKRAEVPPE